MEENTSKREYGSGSVRQLKDGRWEGTLNVGVDEETGKRIRKRILTDSEEECEKQLRELIKEYKKEKALKKSAEKEKDDDYTLGEWVEKWYRLYARPGIRDTTAGTYEYSIYKLIIPRIGDWTLDEITPGKLDLYVAELLEKGKSKGKGEDDKGLSTEVVRKTHAIIKTALDRAVLDGLIKTNPARQSIAPSKKNQKVAILTREEMKRLMIQAKEDGCFEILMLDLATGLRRGELLGLKWNDINFRSGTMSVRREVVLVKGKPTVTPLKTKSSERTAILPKNILEVLKRYKTTVDSEWLFPSPITPTKPRDPSAVRKKLARVLDRANCKHVRFHALRHTFATMALEYGIDVKTLSATLGHSSVDITLDTYSHSNKKMKESAASAIDTSFGRNKGKTILPRRRTEQAEPEKFEAYKGKKRKPGTGYVKQIGPNCWQGRYTPTIDGKRVSRNVYAPTEEECEKKLKELIINIKEEIKAVKQESIAMPQMHL